MEFNITLPGSAPDPWIIEEAIRAIDPAALVDIDPSGQIMRVATSVDATELVALIRDAGYPVAPHEVSQVPSICCGGCSG